MDIKNNSRIKWIDIAKGIATILVVLGHVINGSSDAGLFQKDQKILSDILEFVYMFHMPLFFILSGFVFSKAYYLYNDNCVDLKKPSFKKQTINLISLYFLYSIVLGLSKIVLASFVNKKVTFTDLILIPVKPIQLCWYLYVLIIIYLLFSTPLFRKANNYILLFTLFLISMLSGFLPSDKFDKYFLMKRCLYYAFFFFVGIFISRDIISAKIRYYLFTALGIVSIVLAVIYLPQKGSINVVPSINTLSSLGMSLLVIEITQIASEKFNFTFLQMCGRRSLEIYLIHTYVSTVVRKAMLMTGFANAFWGITINTVISIVIPLIFAEMLAKTKIWSLFFKPYSFVLDIIKPKNN